MRIGDRLRKGLWLPKVVEHLATAALLLMHSQSVGWVIPELNSDTGNLADSFLSWNSRIHEEVLWSVILFPLIFIRRCETLKFMSHAMHSTATGITGLNRVVSRLLRINEHSLPNLDYTTARIHCHFGEILIKEDDPKEAIEHYSRAIGILNHIISTERHLPATRRLLKEAYFRRGDAYSHLAEKEKDGHVHKKGAEISYASAHDSCARDYENSINDYKRAISSCDNTHEKAELYLRVGNAYRESDNLDHTRSRTERVTFLSTKCIENYVNAIKCLEDTNGRTGLSHEQRRAVAWARIARANTSLLIAEIQGVKWHVVTELEESVRKLEDIVKGEVRSVLIGADTNIGLETAYFHLGKAYLGEGKKEQAMKAFIRVYKVYQEYDNSSQIYAEHWHVYWMTRRFRIYVNIFDLVTEFECQEGKKSEWAKGITKWGENVSKQISIAMEEVTARATRSDNDANIRQLRRLYFRFHQRYLRYCIACRTEMIPGILWVMQGRGELAAQVADESSDSWFADDDVVKYRLARRDRRQQDQGILREVCQSITTRQLEEHLADGEAMVLLVESLAQGQCEYGAYVLRHTKRSEWIELRNLGQLIERMKQFRNSYGRNNKRNNADDFWEHMEQCMVQLLWNPLRRIIEQVGKVVVVTHGRLHIVPIHLGKPKELKLVVFPGLVYFLHCRGPTGDDALEKLATGAELGTHYYEGNGENEQLPCAREECQMMCNFLREEKPDAFIVEQHVNYYRFGGTVDTLLISAHGASDGEYGGPFVPEVGPNILLDAVHMQRCRIVARGVFASICSGSAVQDDVDGNPVGLYTKFWLRGTRVFVASLVPIYDMWMPLLTLLTFQVMWRQNGDLEEALWEAKRRLLQNSWFNDTDRYIRPVWRAGSEEWINRFEKEKERKENENEEESEKRISPSQLRNRIIDDIGIRVDKRELRQYVDELYAKDGIRKGRERLIDAIVDACIANGGPSRLDRETLLYGVCAFGESSVTRHR